MSEPAKDEASAVAPPTRKFDPKLLELLVCPLSKTSLDYDAEAQELISRAARLAYPIRDGIPFLVREEAREIADELTPPRR